MPSPIYTAPPGTGTAVLGKTLPSLLDEACARFDNPRAFNQPEGEGWRPLSLSGFRQQAEWTALGLLALGLRRGDRVAFYMDSDVHFCVADMGCLIAGLIDVPIYLSQSDEVIHYVLEHSEAHALIVSDVAGLQEVLEVVRTHASLQAVIVARREPGNTAPALPDGMALHFLDDVCESGRQRLSREPGAMEELKAQLHARDLATIIYTSGTTGKPKGVMLTHENISFNALTAFSGMTGYESGPAGEVGLSFLPLTHVFARTLHYGYVGHGTSVYFTTPEDLKRDLQQVRPTVFATVPRMLEKVHSRLQEQAASLTGVKKRLMAWAMGLAQRYELGREPAGLYKLQLKLADVLVFVKWREALGGRVKFIISGGASLSADLANFFAAAGVNILQGYGLTETSPVITYNRPHRNRAGTVGEPIPEVQVCIADDGEILTRGPHVMKGYFNNAEGTAEAIDEAGWFHTGDVGAFTADGYLRITDRKKDLFKLSTGKYVMPQLLENRLTNDSLVEQAVIVGAGRRFTAALLFPDQGALRSWARANGIDHGQSVERLVQEDAVRARYQELVDEANRGVDHWATVKRFALVPAELTVENGLLTPTLKVKRPKVRERFAEEIEALYEGAEAEPDAREHAAA